MKTKMMMMIWSFFVTTAMVSCGDSSGGDDGPVRNLDVSIEIQGKDDSNPSGDGSGKITVTAVSDGANFFEIDFNDGSYDSNNSGVFEHTYINEGEYEYRVRVFARYADNTRAEYEEVISIYREESNYNTLVWSDEFDYQGKLDSSKWTYEFGDGCDKGICGWGNNESQLYTDDLANAEVRDGSFFITATKEDNGTIYSARVITQDKFEFTYGKVEIRAKLPAGGGTWPAFWMLGANIDQVNWPNCGEIDIMEFRGNQPTFVSSALHTASSFGATQNYGDTEIENPSTEFHVYSVLWTPNKMEFSLDGVVFYTYNPADKNINTWPFFEDQFLIMNTAVGGTLGGEIASDWTSSSMEIDYIRVYQ